MQRPHVHSPVTRRARWRPAMGAAVCLAVLVATVGCSSSGQPTAASTSITSDSSSVGTSTASTQPASLDSFAAIENALVCTPFVDTTTPENLGQSTDALTSHGMQDWQTCHSAGSSFLIVQFDTTDHAAAARSELADGTNTWSFGWSDSVFVLFMIHTNAVDLAKQTFGDQGAGPGSTASSSGSVPSASGLSVTPQSVEYKDSLGYTYTLSINWSADPAKTDVGSEPPGKTDIALTVTHFSGTFTNTTTGGRAFPDQLPVASVVGLYPASSVVCQHSDNADVSAQLTGHNQLWEAKGGGCAVYLYGFLGSPAPGGAFYPNGKDAGVPNGQLISFTVDDTQFSYADTPPSLHISGVDETRAAAWVKALNKPIALGVAAGPNDVPQGSTPKCVYTDAGASYLTTNIAIYTSISGGTPPGCA